MRTEDGNSELKLLFLGDANLGRQGIDIIEDYFAGATCLIWDMYDRNSLRNHDNIKKTIHSQMWDICLSFYSDFIFDDTDLAQMHLALNIHPALPLLRGVGYDTLPLIEGHKNYGVTLHHVINKIDAGKIVSILKKDISEDMTYSQLRRATQDMCLKMLAITAEDIHNKSLTQIRNILESKSNQVNDTWNAAYTSRKQLKKLLDGLREKVPDHRVFK